MRKVQKQLYIRIILAVVPMAVAFSVIIVMAVFQKEGESYPAYINALGIAGFFIPMGIAIFLLIRLLGKSIVIGMLARELSELKKHKDFYYGAFNCGDEKSYLDTIAGGLQSAKYKDLTAEVNLDHESYKFYLRKHFWKLDSTNIHVHMAVISADAAKITDYFCEIASRELSLGYGKFKGSYCAIVAVCAVKGFKANEQFLSFFHEQIFPRGIAIVKVLIDTAENKVYVSRGGAVTGARGQRIVKKFILKTKSFKSCRGEFTQNAKQIAALEKKLDEMDFKKAFTERPLTTDEKAYADSLPDGGAGFLKGEADREGGIVFYKKNDRVLYLYCDYDEHEKTFGIIGLDYIRWDIPKKQRISRKERKEISLKIIEYLRSNDIPYDIVDMVYSKENQAVLSVRHK